MKFGILNRPVALITSAALLAGGTLIAGASSSAAAGNMVGLIYEDHQVYRGKWSWSSDPSDGKPGDAFRVTDDVADGWGIEGDLNATPIRVATTQGHSAPYTSPWASGDLPEDKDYELDIWIMKNGTYKYIQSVTVTT